MIIPLTSLYEAFFIFDLILGLAWTGAAFTNPALEESLLRYLGWIGALMPLIHAIALGRGLMVRRLVVILPIFALTGDLYFRWIMSPSLIREIHAATPGISDKVAEYGVAHHPTALFFGLAFAMVGIFVFYPLYRRLLSIVEGQEGE